jgi:DUF4097 and DUF4098 domain-containing protein YvlB
MRLSPWGRVVAISALLIVGGLLALVFAGLASRERRLVSYPVKGALQGLTFDLGDGDITIVGGGRRDDVQIGRTERYAFGRSPRTAREVKAGVFGVISRCPTSLLSPCTVAYRVVVPDNVAIAVRTTKGNVVLRGYRGSAKVATTSGGIDIAGYCGNSLDARAGAGAIALDASCAPPQLTLRTGSGDVHADTTGDAVTAESGSGDVDVRAPRARGLRLRSGSGDVSARVGDVPYTVRVDTGSGDEHVTVPTDPRAPRSIDARTGSGDVRLSPVS